MKTMQRQNFGGKPGADVIMTTVFCDFRQFLGEKNWRFSQTPILLSPFWHNLALF
jgi:hypothetical protein